MTSVSSFMHLRAYLLVNSASFCLENWFSVDGVTYSLHRSSRKSSQLQLAYPGKDCQMWHCKRSTYWMTVSTFWRLESLQLSASSLYSSKKSSIRCSISPEKCSASFDCADSMVAVFRAGVWDMMVV